MKKEYRIPITAYGSSTVKMTMGTRGADLKIDLGCIRKGDSWSLEDRPLVPPRLDRRRRALLMDTGGRVSKFRNESTRALGF